jgi:hypothetical protein
MEFVLSLDMAQCDTIGVTLLAQDYILFEFLHKLEQFSLDN